MRTLYRSTFKEIGEAGNEKLLGRKVTVAGVGGIGSVVTSMLTREDFDLRIIDRGRVEEMDMNRMGLFIEQDITKFKAKQAKSHASAINPKVSFKSFHEELNESNVFLVKADCVIDATNNPETNEQIFSYCQKEKIPLIIARYAGSKAEILIATKKLTKKAFEEFLKIPTIDEEGALSPTTHGAAAIVVSELFKLLLNKGAAKRVTLDVWGTKIKEKKL